MSLIGIDLGGTKLAIGVFNENGVLLHKNEVPVAGNKGKDVGALIIGNIRSIINSQFPPVKAIGISVPGISNHHNGTVWAPNIPGWVAYPLLEEVREISSTIAVSIDSDRSCYILGEVWQGNAQGCTNAIFMSVGTGIGAGILVDGNVLHGANDIAGAIGWMALEKPFSNEYISCGCFEENASGNGIAKMARKLLAEDTGYTGQLKNKPGSEITSHDVFAALQNEDILAVKVMQRCIEYWGMAIANLVSIFNPEKIILGGGVFGPALKFIPEIKQEAAKWAQPVSFRQMTIEPSALGNDAGIYGAAFLALQLLQKKYPDHV